MTPPTGAGWLSLVSDELGPSGPPQPIGDGLWRVRVGHRQLVAKVGPGVADEAEGLRRLGRVDGAPPVPEVVLERPDLLVTSWVEPGVRSPDHDEAMSETVPRCTPFAGRAGPAGYTSSMPYPSSRGSE